MIFQYILYILLSPSWFVSFPCLLSLLNPYGRKRIHDDPCGIRFQNTDLSLGLQWCAPPNLRTQKFVRVINLFFANIKSTCCIILVGSVTIFVGKISDFAGSPANLRHHRLPKTARVPACHGGVFLHLPGFTNKRTTQDVLIQINKNYVKIFRIWHNMAFACICDYNHCIWGIWAADFIWYITSFRSVPTSFSSPVAFFGVWPRFPTPRLLLVATCFTWDAYLVLGAFLPCFTA